MGEDRFVSQKRERPNILLKAAKFNFHDGDPDLGKSLITLDLAARVTTGQPMPDGSPGITGNVILIAPEDDAADTIKPRILAAGSLPDTFFTSIT